MKKKSVTQTNQLDKLSRKLAQHESHNGLYIAVKKNVVELRCFARTHGGDAILLFRRRLLPHYEKDQR